MSTQISFHLELYLCYKYKTHIYTNRPPDAKSPPNYRNNSPIPQTIIHTWKTMDIYSGHLLPCYLLSIDHHCNLSLVLIPIPIILKSPSMDSSLHSDAFPSNDFSSEFQFDCAFGFDGEIDFGFGGGLQLPQRAREWPPTW